MKIHTKHPNPDDIIIWLIQNVGPLKDNIRVPDYAWTGEGWMLLRSDGLFVETDSNYQWLIVIKDEPLATACMLRWG